MFDTVRALYAKTGRTLLPPLGFNNTFAILVRGADARVARAPDDRRCGARVAALAGRVRLRVRRAAGRLSRPGEGLRAAVSRSAARDGPDADLPGAGGRAGRRDRRRRDGRPDQGARSGRSSRTTGTTSRPTTPRRWRAPRRCCAIRSVRTALEGLAGRVSAADMRAMNYAADVEHRDVAGIVREFLARTR